MVGSCIPAWGSIAVVIPRRTTVSWLRFLRRRGAGAAHPQPRPAGTASLVVFVGGMCSIVCRNLLKRTPERFGVCFLCVFPPASITTPFSLAGHHAWCVSSLRCCDSCAAWRSATRWCPRRSPSCKSADVVSNASGAAIPMMLVSSVLCSLAFSPLGAVCGRESWVAVPASSAAFVCMLHCVARRASTWSPPTPANRLTKRASVRCGSALLCLGNGLTPARALLARIRAALQLLVACAAM